MYCMCKMCRVHCKCLRRNPPNRHFYIFFSHVRLPRNTPILIAKFNVKKIKTGKQDAESVFRRMCWAQPCITILNPVKQRIIRVRTCESGQQKRPGFGREKKIRVRTCGSRHKKLRILEQRVNFSMKSRQLDISKLNMISVENV